MLVGKTLTEQKIADVAIFFSQLAYYTDGTNGPAKLDELAQHIAEVSEFSAEDCLAICNYLIVYGCIPGTAVQLITTGFARTFPQTV